MQCSKVPGFVSAVLLDVEKYLSDTGVEGSLLSRVEIARRIIEGLRPVGSRLVVRTPEGVELVRSMSEIDLQQWRGRPGAEITILYAIEEVPPD